MSFPITSKLSTSLCHNIAKGLDPLPIQVRPSLQKVFANLKELLCLLSLDVGSARELRDCANLLSPQTALSDADQNSLRECMLLALKIQGMATGKKSHDASKPLRNLDDALRSQRDQTPPLNRLLQVLKELIDSTGLEIWPLSEWVQALRISYPYEERSPIDKRAWSDFVTFYSNRPARLNQLLGEFAKGYERREAQRELVQHLRQIAERDNEVRIATLFQSEEMQKGDWRQQSFELQRLLNALLAEETAAVKFKEILADLKSFLIDSMKKLMQEAQPQPDDGEGFELVAAFDPLKQWCGSTFDPKRAFDTLKKLNIQGLNRLVDQESPLQSKVIMELFHNLFDKLEKICSKMCRKQSDCSLSRRMELAQRSFGHLDDLRSAVPSLVNSADLRGSLNPSQIYIDYFQREVDLHTFECRAQIQLMQLAEWCAALSAQRSFQPVDAMSDTELSHREKSPLDTESARAMIPALIAFESRFASFWIAAMTATDRLEAEFSQGINDLNLALNLLQIDGSQRGQLYENLYLRLQQLKPKKSSERREALQFVKTFLHFPDRQGVLPATLQFHSRSNGSDHRGAKARRAQRRPVPSALTALSTKDEDLIFDPLLRDFEVIPKGPQLIRLGNWTSPFNYHKRVARWFDAAPPLSKKLFPEYSQKPLAHQHLMVRLHRFLPLADFFCQRGIRLQADSSRGKLITRFVLPAELSSSDEKLRGVIVWAVDGKNICYHRFFHIKLESDLIINTVQRAFGISESESADNDEARDSETLQFSDRGEDFVEIDELAGLARLRHAKVDDLDLQLRFVK